MLTCLDGALDFYLGGSLTETLSSEVPQDWKVLDFRKIFLSFV